MNLNRPQQPDRIGEDHAGRKVELRAWSGYVRSAKADRIRQRNGPVPDRQGMRIDRTYDSQRKLSDADCEEIRLRYRCGVPLDEIADRFGISRNYCRKVAKGEVRA